MKKKSLLLFFAFLCTAVSTVTAQNGTFISLGENTTGRAVSPGGKYVVGVNPSYYMYGIYMKSFIFTVNSKSPEWKTDYVETDLDKGGDFADVNDNGDIAGTFKDTEHVLTLNDFDGTRTAPINQAAVWKDGVRTGLGLGDVDVKEYTQFEDGTFANALSNDGSTVAGYIGTGNMALFYPCVWREDGGKWTFSRLELPEWATSGTAIDVSADGSVILGNVSVEYSQKPGVWIGGKCKVLALSGDDAQYEQSVNKASGISPNGRYVAFKLNYSTGCIYDLQTDSYVKIPTFGDMAGVGDGLSVDDNGDAAGAYGYGGRWQGVAYERPFRYFGKDKRIIDFDYYMQVFAPDAEAPFSMAYADSTKAEPAALSADGKTVMGNYDTMMSLGGIPQCWVMTAVDRDVTIPEAPQGLEARSDKFREVTLTWNTDKKSYGNMTLESYNLYCNGKLSANSPVAGGDTQTYTVQNATTGYPKYEVAAVFRLADGSSMESPRSNTASTAVPDTYSLPLFDDFDSGTTQTNFWTVESYSGDMYDNTFSTIDYFGLSGKGLYTSSYSQKSYDGAIVSRPLDATGLKDIHASFSVNYSLVNSTDWPLDKDTLSVDVTTDDGKTWKEAGAYTLAGLSTSWTMVDADLSPLVAGKMFRMRLRKHGLGAAMYSLAIDVLKVGSTGEAEAPDGLTGADGGTEGNLRLIWKDGGGVYRLNHITGFDNIRLVVGDEGNDFIAANKFDAADLLPYKNKYLTSVSAFINHDAQIAGTKDTHASVVVFVDGNLVCEQEMKDIVYNQDNVVRLDNPVSVDGAKSVIVGLKIYDYDERQMPVTYQNTDRFTPGKSDLYSQDGGKTWLKLSDFYAQQGMPQQGYCNWEISAGFSDTPDYAPAADEEGGGVLLGYNIFRNGEKLNAALLDSREQRYTDASASLNDYYEVVAYYLDGSVSSRSERYVYTATQGIGGVQNSGAPSVSVDRNTGTISIDGEFDTAALFNINGTAVRTSYGNSLKGGLAPGVYVLRIVRNGHATVRKVYVPSR